MKIKLNIIDIKSYRDEIIAKYIEDTINAFMKVIKSLEEAEEDCEEDIK